MTQPPTGDDRPRTPAGDPAPSGRDDAEISPPDITASDESPQVEPPQEATPPPPAEPEKPAATWFTPSAQTQEPAGEPAAAPASPPEPPPAPEPPAQPEAPAEQQPAEQQPAEQQPAEQRPAADTPDWALPTPPSNPTTTPPAPATPPATPPAPEQPTPRAAPAWAQSTPPTNPTSTPPPATEAEQASAPPQPLPVPSPPHWTPPPGHPSAPPPPPGPMGPPQMGPPMGPPPMGPPGPVAPWAALPGPAAAPPKPRGRRGLLIASIVLAVVVLLCGGGGLAAFLVLRDVDTAQGAPEPAVAVDRFMQAVYTDRNAALAATTVCPAARDAEALERRVEEVQEYADNYPSPKFRWETPKVDEQTPDRAVVSVDLTVTTADDRRSQQELRFTVVRDTGWWVCDIG